MISQVDCHSVQTQSLGLNPIGPIIIAVLARALLGTKPFLALYVSFWINWGYVVTSPWYLPTSITDNPPSPLLLSHIYSISSNSTPHPHASSVRSTVHLYVVSPTVLIWVSLYFTLYTS